MKTITCPSCGFAFETAATTNTRCRRCHKVVHVGSSPRNAARAELDNDGYYYDEEDNEPAGSGAGGLLALLGAAAAVGLGVWWASRSANAPGEPEPPQAQPPPAGYPFGTPGI